MARSFLILHGYLGSGAQYQDQAMRFASNGIPANRIRAFDYNYVANPIDAWLTIIVMDVWHWSSLVALLCYAGLKSIPDAYYQAAQIDGQSSVPSHPESSMRYGCSLTSSRKRMPPSIVNGVMFRP